MELKQALEKLKKSKEFMEWNNRNPDNFLSYAFKIIENNKESPWQLGYYHKTTDKMASFIINEDSIETQNEEEIFKKPDAKVRPLDTEKVKLPFRKILKKSEELHKDKYPREIISKTIAILQNLEKYGNIWNITYITLAFNTLNMKINPENGQITEHKMESLMNFIKK